DPSGTLVWSRQIQSQLNGAFLKVGGIAEAANGELFLSGSTRFNSEGSWLAKLNTDGLIQNVTFYDTHSLTDSQPEPFAIHARSNGEMDIFYNSTAFQDKSILLALRTDASGVPLQAKKYYIPHPNGGEITDVFQTANDAYVLSGYHFPNGFRSKGLAMGLDANDNITWTGEYGTDYIEIFTGIIANADGSLIMTGFADPDSMIISPSENGLFPWLVKTDAMGQADCFYNTIAISSNDTTVQSSPYQLSESSGPVLGDINFFTFDMNNSLDSLVCEPAAIETLPTSSFKLYPNPTNGPLKVELAKPFPASILLLSNQMGQSVLRRSLHTEQNLSLEIDAPAGLYYLSLITPSGERLSRKLILE
ncbi:MAG: T9SS type A sorting domain-containing protein, partial [Bacteroidia bacterium]